jgi:hypothetical protein
MNQIQKKNHYQILKVTVNAKAYVIEAAYNALMKDIETSDRDTDSCEKIKNTLSASYAILSDPIKKAAYDQQLKNTDKIEVLKKPIIENADVKILKTENLKVEHNDLRIKNTENNSIKESVALENKQNSPQFKYIKPTLISVGIVSIIFACYFGYKLYPINIQEKTTNSIKKIEDTETYSKNDSTESMVDNLSLNKSNEDQVNKEEKSYNSAVEKEKMSDVERLDARKSRRDNLSARQDDMDFDDYEQQYQNRKKILKADSENIAIMQQTIQDYDIRIQNKIRENSRIEQEEAESFAKAESAREIEIKRITAEQVEIDRMLTDNDRRSRELTKKLINI